MSIEEERAAVRERAETMLELRGVTIADVIIEQNDPVPDLDDPKYDLYDEWGNSDDCSAVLTLADGRRFRISAETLDYDGEDSTPVLEMLS